MPAVFIRAPVVASVGQPVEVLARLAVGSGADDPVALRQGHVVAAAFHPELTSDRRLHRLLLSLVEGADGVVSSPGRRGSTELG
jgi:pyridoxal 5'-phosphate synthase pdxT subunit